MNLSLTNNTDEPEVIGTPDGSWAGALTPNTPLDFNSDATVLVIGDKPEMREQLERAAGTLSGVVKHLLTLVFGRKQQAEASAVVEVVSVTVLNRGAQPVRVILGEGVADLVIEPGASTLCFARGYLEMRELGAPD
jgi:hypothetical protein